MSGLFSRAATHPGAVRKRNEDAFVDRPDIGLWAVADGAGGHGAGDVASGAIADALAGIPPHLGAAELLAQVRLRLTGVHEALLGHPAPGGRTPASTVVALLARAGHFAVLWAGDSRAYLLRGGALRRLTRDHSLVQEMVDAGTLTEEEAERHAQANVITRAVGAPGDLVLDKVSGPLLPGDVLLLCSDGLFKEVAEAEIGPLLAGGQGPEALLAEAVRRGARDNVTAVEVRAG
jgi:protein phosphatase/serine/threonine-protein phosphatase Stp1